MSQVFFFKFFRVEHRFFFSACQLPLKFARNGAIKFANSKFSGFFFSPIQRLQRNRRLSIIVLSTKISVFVPCKRHVVTSFFLGTI